MPQLYPVPSDEGGEITSFVVSFSRHAAAHALRLFAKEVIAAFR